jgi:hypothetical protein
MRASCPRHVWTALLPQYPSPLYPTSCNSKKPSRKEEPDALGCISRRTAHPFTTTKDATMPRVKQASKHARTTKAVAATALGTAGLGLSLGGSASANTIPTADFPPSHNIPPDQRFVLGEEEMADVSLATFYLSDKEIAGSDMMQLAVVVVRRGCGGCRGCRACRGCAVRGCGGCGGCGVGGCCARWGRCRIC